MIEVLYILGLFAAFFLGSFSAQLQADKKRIALIKEIAQLRESLVSIQARLVVKDAEMLIEERIAQGIAARLHE